MSTKAFTNNRAVLRLRTFALGSGIDINLFGLGRSFALLWFGRTIAGLGGALLNFALGVWVYQETGSAQQFAMVFLASTLPALIFLPLAGTLADYFDRRWVIVSTDIAAAVIAITLAILVSLDAIVAYHLYVFGAVNAALASLRNPAYIAAVSAVIPRDVLTRANGLLSLSLGLLGMVAPLLAGFLMATVGLTGIVFIQLPLMTSGAFAVFAAFTHAKDKMRPPPKSERPSALRSLVVGLSSATNFLRRQQPLLLALLAYQVLHDGLLVLASVMVMPLILSTHTSITLGSVSSCGAAGGLVGAALLTIANTKKRLMAWLFGSNICLSICVVVAGMFTSTMLWCVCAFVAFFSASAGGTCSQALWMRKTPNSIQGSIFSLLQVCQLVVASVVMFGGGVLGEHLLEPAFATGGVLAESIGQWIGTGQGRGLGFLFILSGSFSIVTSMVFLAGSRVRELDESVVDAHEVADM